MKDMKVLFVSCNYLFLFLLYFILPACNSHQNERIEVRFKADSILNLNYNKNDYTLTLKELAKWDSATAAKLENSITSLNDLPCEWPKKSAAVAAMDTMLYWELDDYITKVLADYDYDEPFDSLNRSHHYGNSDGIEEKKPVIYLYPTSEQNISVQLGFKGTNLYTWPRISDNNTWNVTARPDGLLTDVKGEQYPYLFWEGTILDFKYDDFDEGFVVAGNNTELFLLEKLKLLGLNAREYTDFITFWAPQMRKNYFNFIRFETTINDELVPLTIIPKPESIQRILMVYKPVDYDYKVKPQKLVPFRRKGFTVIEWGGVDLKKLSLKN